MSKLYHHPRSLPYSLGVTLMLGLLSGAQAVVLKTGDVTQINAFKVDATVENFDSISGITAVPIPSYNALDIGGTSALFTKNPAGAAYFNSGLASFNDPAGNPGTPIGIASPGGGIAGDVFSGSNVAGPLGVGSTVLFEAGAFMEVIFPTAVSKVGIFVTHGSIQLILKDLNNSNIATGDASGTADAGQFLGIDRGVADIRGVTILGNGAFTIDDFTYSGNGTAPGVPEPGVGLCSVLAFAGLLGFAGKRAKSQRSPA